MDKNLGGIIWSGRKKHLGGSGTCEGASHQKGKENICRIFEKFVTEGNEKAEELAKSRSNVGRRMYGRSKSRNTMQQGREEVCAALQYAARGRTAMSSGPSRKESVFSWKKERQYEASNRVVCGSE